MEHHSGSLTGLAIVVVAALACGIAMRKFKQPPVLGYILAGVFLGPSGLALVEDRDNISTLAELGVLMLLFVIGMNLSLRGIKEVWQVAVITTAAQIGVGVGGMWLLGQYMGWSFELILFFGFVFALSSTAVAVKMLQEINEYGRWLKIHGVNLSVGYDFEPEWFACGQSPLCLEVDRLVKSGVVVVAAAGNTGYGYKQTQARGPVASGMMMSVRTSATAMRFVLTWPTHSVCVPLPCGLSVIVSQLQLPPRRVSPTNPPPSATTAEGRGRPNAFGLRPSLSKSSRNDRDIFEWRFSIFEYREFGGWSSISCERVRFSGRQP